jgi:nicotinate-nucleotide adenylyltransferase
MGRIGVFGGSFDPIHNGHLITAAAVMEQRRLEKIIFVPCHLSPHKIDRTPTPAHHRMTMVNLAIKDRPEFDSCDFELKNGGVSYTIDTLQFLKQSFNEIDLIIGYDNLVVFDSWKNPDDIIAIASLVVLNRKIENTLPLNKYFQYAVIAQTPVIEISGSDIRERRRRNLPIDFLVPDSVKTYIEFHNLYRGEKL